MFTQGSARGVQDDWCPHFHVTRAGRVVHRHGVILNTRLANHFTVTKLVQNYRYCEAN
jgi:hypothetical protein